MGNDAVMDMMKAVRHTITGPRDDTIIDIQQTLERETLRSTAVIGMHNLAKMIAAEYIKSISINEIRKEITSKMSAGRRPLSIEELYIRSFYKLNIDLIWNVYYLIVHVESTYAKKMFSVNFKDPYSTLIINAAFEVATRCVGLSYNSRETAADFRAYVGSEISANNGKVVMGIGRQLKEANVNIVNHTVILAILPFMTLCKTENVISVMPINDYAKKLRNFADRDCSHSDRIVFNKLASDIESKLYHKDALIRLFDLDDLSYKNIMYIYTSNPLVSLIEGNLADLNIQEAFKDFVEKQVVCTNLTEFKANIFTRFVYSTIDWVWRIRMGWNHDLAVGSETTWIYTNMFSVDVRAFGTSFKYVKNRYLLETIGQSFIGYESTAYDAKCRRLRALAKGLFNLTHVAIDGNLEELCSVTMLKRIYTSTEQDDVDLYAFINTLDILMKETDLFTLHHLMTAFIFYGKYLLKDYALVNINVNSDITFNDIELWLNYD